MIGADPAYRLLFESAPHAYLVLRAAPDFEIVFANARYLAMIGVRREEIVGRRLFDALSDMRTALAPDGAEKLRASLRRAMRQDAPGDEIRLRCGSNGQREWKWINTPAPDERGKPAFILCHIEDVTPLTRVGEVPAGNTPDVAIGSERPRIIVAESDAVLRGHLEVLLKDWGFDPISVDQTEAALAACLVRPPALLLCDAASPGMDGVGLTRRLRADERTAALPIMIISAHCGERARIEGYDAGADEYLEKPFADAELKARVMAVIRIAGARENIAGRRRRVAVLARLASVVETAMDAVISVNEKQEITLFNAAAERMFGCDVRAALGRPLDDFIPHRFRGAHARQVEAFGKTGVSGRTMGHLGDLTALRADGREFPIEASISQARVDGELLFTVILRDMSERQAAMETQRLLVGELDHRVKNTLAMVQAIANQTAKAYADPKLFAENFNGRVRAMASAHSLLTQAGWKGADLADLIHEQLALGADPRIMRQGADVFLGPQVAMHFGMVLHELGANARKYGALSRSEGRLDLNWSVETIDHATSLTFNWVETGGPPAEPPKERHFGTRLIESSLTHSLHGTVELDFAPGGLRCKINLPLRPSLA